MKVLGITGLPGSGKSVITRTAKNRDIEVVRMGDVIREEAEKRNISSGEVAVVLRKEYGEFIIAERSINKIKEMMSKHEKNNIKDEIFIIEGIRSPDEVKLFKKHFNNFKVIAVYSSPKTRFNRLIKRNRADDSSNISEIKKRDERELRFGIGSVIATADYMIINEGPIWKFKNNIKNVLKKEIQND